MSDWQSLTLADLLADEVRTIAGAATDAATFLTPILTTIADVVRLAAIFLQDFLDPAAGTLPVLIDEINNFLDDLRDSDVFFLPVFSKEAKKLKDFEKTFQQFLDDIDASFRDEGDLERPQFTESASIGGMVIFIGASTLIELADQAAVLGTIFSNVPGFSELFGKTLLSLIPGNGFELDEDVVASPSPQTVRVTNIPTAFFEVDENGNLVLEETLGAPARLKLRGEFTQHDIQVGDSGIGGDPVVETTRYTDLRNSVTQSEFNFTASSGIVLPTGPIVNTMTAVFRQPHSKGTSISITENTQPGAVRLKERVDGIQLLPSSSDIKASVIRVESTKDFTRSEAIYSIGTEPTNEFILARPIDFTVYEKSKTISGIFDPLNIEDVTGIEVMGDLFINSVKAPEAFLQAQITIDEITPPTVVENEFMLVLNGPLRDHEIGEPVFPQGGKLQASEPPDWSRSKVKDVVPFLGEVFDLLDKFARSIQPSVSITSSVSLFADALENKALEISEAASTISALIQQFDDLFLKDGPFILMVPPATGGVNEFMSQLRSAGNEPPFDFDGAMGAGAVLLVGGPSAAAVQTAFDALSKIF